MAGRSGKPKGNITVEVRGLETVEAAYRVIREGAEDMPGTQQAIANLLVPAIVSAAPKRTGALARSVGASADPDRVRIAVSVRYAGVIEWGWAAKNIRGQHYANRAIQANAGEIERLYTTGLDAVCRRAQGGAT